MEVGRRGTLTFLVADVEDSDRLWRAAPDAIAKATGAYDEIVSQAVGRHGGERWRARAARYRAVAMFPGALDALEAALDIGRAARAHERALDVRLRVAVHTAERAANARGGHRATAIARCARLCTIARGSQVLLSRATRDGAERLPPGAGLADLGVHRLPDLGPPERVYRLTHPDLPEDPRPPRSLDTLPNNLPWELTSFVGRERELDEVLDALAATRLLTLTGAAGCGKTRLALQAAADAFDRFPGGVWWVELAPLADPALIGQVIATALGVRPLPGQSPLGAAVTHLAGRPALVLLDNCEHLVEGAGEAAAALLRGCPEATVMVASRVPLEQPLETTWLVPPLSLPDERLAPVEALAGSDAMQLFVERATQARHDFTVTEANAEALVEVCSRLDGIPLAIELAAARVRLRSLEQIAAGLSDRFRLLGGPGSVVLSRHGTLRASVEWSHELLSDDQRVLFRRLGVFAGGFTLDAAEAVVAIGEAQRAAVLDGLAALVDRSLVVTDERGSSMRYRLLETMREYALERLRDTEELEAARDRHLDFFLALAERSAPALVTASRREELKALDADSANLAAALAWAAESDSERMLRLCAALTFWWGLRGMFATADANLARALEVSDPSPSALRARVLWARGLLLIFTTRFEEAVRLTQEALASADTVGDTSTVARALTVLCAIRNQVDPLGTRPVAHRARRLARACGDDWCFVMATSAAGWTHLVTDEYDEAERLFEERLPGSDHMGYQGFMWVGMCYIQMNRGDGAGAVEWARRALSGAGELGEPVTEGFARAYIGRLELAEGRVEQAVERLESSRDRLFKAEALMAIPATDAALARALVASGDLDRARAVLEPELGSGADFGWYLSWILAEFADLLRIAGELDDAERRAREALEVGERIHSPLSIAWAKELLGRLAAERGEWGEAEALLHEALATRAELGLRFWLPQTLDALAMVAAGLSAHADASRVLGAAGRAWSDLGFVRWVPDGPRFERLERELRRALGEEAFAAAWDEGAGLTLDESVAWVRRGRGARRRPPAGWASLTPTELEVARHAAAGLTNPQIATAMFVSRATVKTHLSHIYAKLDVRNRAQLTAEVTRRRPADAP